MIKVLHVIVGLNVGGAELMLKRLILNGSKDIEHQVISLTSIGEIGQELRRSGVPVFALEMDGFLSMPFAFIRLLKLFRDIDPDLVHTWMYHGDLIGGLGAWLAGKKKIIWCVRSTNIEVGGGKPTIFIRKLCALLSRFIPRKIVYAANASRVVHEDIGYLKNKSLVIPNGFSNEYFNGNGKEGGYFREELGIGRQRIIIGSVGRFHPVKDHSMFISVARNVADHIDQAVFVLIGRDLDSHNVNLLSEIDSHGLRDKFFLLGERNDVVKILPALDVFCLHSRTEGFPNVLGEAMASGLPCVTTDVGDATYLLGSNEYAVESGDVSSFSSRVIELARFTKAKRNEIGATNRDRIRSNFTISSIVSRYESLYKDINKPNSMEKT